jgi:hypothetical protein
MELNRTPAHENNDASLIWAIADLVRTRFLPPWQNE